MTTVSFFIFSVLKEGGNGFDLGPGGQGGLPGEAGWELWMRGTLAVTTRCSPWGHRPMLGHVAVEAFIWGLHPRPPSPVQPQGNGQLRAHPFQQTASGAQLWTHPWL